MRHRIGIVGLGVMGERMLRNMGEHPAFDVATLWDPVVATRERLGSLPERVRFAADARDLVSDPAVSCVYIASPPASHLAYATLAMDHGKAVFCEKPLAVSLVESRRVVERVEREGHRAAVNFPFASAPAVRAIASGLRSRELGPVECVEIELAFAAWPRPWQATARWLAGREQGGFGREVLSHFLFLTLRLLGPLSIGECRVDYPEDERLAETAIAAQLLAGGVPVTITGRIGGEIPDSNCWRLHGRHGAFELHDWYSLKRRIDGVWLDIDFGDDDMRKMAYRAQLDALAALLSGRPHTLPTFREGLAVQECVEAMLTRT